VHKFKIKIYQHQTFIDFRSKLEETKELQKLRKRPHGVSVVGLALGKKVTMEEEVTSVGRILFYYRKQELS
jgi:hypothetical protein